MSASTASFRRISKLNRRRRMYREKQIGKMWLHFGIIRGLWFGIQIDRYGIELNLGFCFIGIEY